MSVADDVARLRALASEAASLTGTGRAAGETLRTSPLGSAQAASQAARAGRLPATNIPFTPELSDPIDAFFQTPAGKVFRGIGVGEELGSGAILGTLLRSIDSTKYQELLRRGGPIYASDYLRALLPNAPDAVIAGGGFALGTAFDPLTYVGGIGTLSRVGRAAKMFAAGDLLPFEKAPGFLAKEAARDGLRVLPRAKQVRWVRGRDLNRIMSVRGFEDNFFVLGKAVDGRIEDTGLLPLRVISNTDQFPPIAQKKLTQVQVETRKGIISRRLSRKRPQADLGATPPDKGTWYRVFEIEDSDDLRASVQQFMQGKGELGPEALRPGGTNAAYREFLKNHAENVSHLTREEKVRQGLVGLIQLQVPGFDQTRVTIGNNLSKMLQTLRVPAGIADSIELEAKGLRVFQALDWAQDAIRHTRLGQKVGALLNIKGLMDPRLVAISNRIISALHGSEGELFAEVGLKIERRIENLTEDLFPIFKKHMPGMSRKEVKTKIGEFVDELVHDNTVIPRELWDKHPNYKAWAERLNEFLPQNYTTPFLGGAQHPLDDGFAAEIRELVRHHNEMNWRILQQLRAEGIAASELIGDANYVTRALTEQARKTLRNAPSQRRKVGFLGRRGKRIREALVKDMNSVRRSFRDVNLQPLVRLISQGNFQGPQLNKLLAGLGGIKVEEASHAILQVSLLHSKGVITKEQWEASRDLLMSIRNKTADLDVTRRRAIDELFDLYEAKTLSVDNTRELIHHWSINEVNQHVAQHGLPTLGIKPGQVPKLFVTEPGLQIITRGERALRVASDRQFIRAVMNDKTLVKKASEESIPEGWVSLGDVFGRIIPGAGDDVFADPAIARHLDAYGRYMLDPMSAVGGVINIHDKLQNLWKTWTLVLFPSYHARNNVGNIWNNWLAGMGIGETKYYIRATQMMNRLGRTRADLITREGFEAARARAAARGEVFDAPELPDLLKTVKDGVVKTVDGRKLTLDQLWREGQKRALFDTGRITGDVPNVIHRQLRRHSRDVRKWHAGAFPTVRGSEAMRAFDKDSWMLDLGFEVGSYFENASKLAHFLWRIDKGDTLDEAANSVKRFLFDYADLSGFERDVMRRIFPFYTWTRKNIPLQLEMLVSDPARFARIPRTIRSTQDAVGVGDTPGDERFLSDWMRRAMPVRISRNKSTGQFNYFLLDSWLPAAEINRLFEWDYMLKSMFAPFPKLLIEQIFNMELRTGREIDKLESNLIRSLYKGERDKVFGVPFPRRVAYSAKSMVRLLRDMDNLFANPREMDLADRMLGLFVGRVYASDPQQAYLEGMRQRRVMNLGYAFAERSALLSKGDVKEARRVRDLRKKRLAEFDRERFGSPPRPVNIPSDPFGGGPP